MDLVLWLNSFTISMNQPAPCTSPSYPGTQTLVSQGILSGPAVSHGDSPEDILLSHPKGMPSPVSLGRGRTNMMSMAPPGSPPPLYKLCYSSLCL